MVAGARHLAAGQRGPISSPPRTFLGRVFDVLARSLAALLIALIFSILMEWSGMTWWWPDSGAQHAEALYRAERAYLVDALRLRGGYTACLDWVVAEGSAPTAWLQGRVRARLAPVLGAQAVETLRAYLAAAGWIIRVFGLRLTLVWLCLPSVLLFVLIGFSEGLMRRDLRRWGGGRESSFIYHHVRPWIAAGWLGSVCLYLSLPFAVHPVAWWLPTASSIGLAVAVTTSRFKKYL